MKIILVDDITQTMVVEKSGMEFLQYYPATHYECPERQSGSFIKNHFDLVGAWKPDPTKSAIRFCDTCGRCEQHSPEPDFSW